MRLLLVRLLGMVVFVWTTLAVGQQAKKIDDQALKTAENNEWTINGMDWGGAALMHNDPDQS